MNINYNKFFLNNPLLATLNTIFAKTLFKTSCCLMSLSFFVTSYTYTKYLNLQTRHKIVQSGISRLNKNRLFVFCNVHYYLTRLSYHLRSCLNQSLLSFLFFIIVRWKLNYTSECVRSTSLTRQSFWFVFIHVEI